MNFFDGAELREIFLSVGSMRRRWEALLSTSGLQPEADPDYTVGVFDAEDNLIGTASLHQDIIKYVAISSEHRGESIANTLISALWSHVADRGISDLVIFTKPEYADLFTDLSFKLIGRTRDAVMLESSLKPLKAYTDYLRAEREKRVRPGEKAGVIVMNTNPLTEGHLYLIKYAAGEVDRLFIVPLADNSATQFGYPSRRRALLRATRNMENVTVLEGSRYCISSATFPSYFIKERTRLTDTHIHLDLDIFLRHIAPALGAKVRFAGEEPADPLTARYNELMKRILPENGIEVREIARLRAGSGKIISASAVRSSLANLRLNEVLDYVSVASLPAVLAKAVAIALGKELELTPKPGLIDRNNSGAHKDMDYQTMLRSIEALEPIFERISEVSLMNEPADATLLQPIGREGEQLMFSATGNVNTHKGALFSLGLAISAVSHILYKTRDAAKLTPANISDTISKIAATFSRPVDTNGAAVASKYGVPTAIDAACAGYADAIERWADIPDSHIRLLTIMSEMADSNVFHRGGPSGDTFIRQRSRDLLTKAGNCTLELEKFDRECIERNISPGGSADMLALTYFIESVIARNNYN